jgi:serine/threonine protein kinase
MALAPGDRLGSYEIVAPLGAGGMGEVYRARDTRLNRDVAVKVLPVSVAEEPERVARFQREAQLLASLNHPHIAQIYGVEQGALVMELVPGQPLSASIGALSVADALSLARQIADALEAAHEKNIIHRDLKPGNVMITPDGQAKLLDFGLGKTIDVEPSGDVSTSPTMTAFGAPNAGGQTQMGLILGTAAYMAPEQARGRAADKRCDVWAFGCVLYEMLTGKRAFEGEDVSDTLANILKTDVDWSALPVSTPPHVTRLIGRCLQKDRKLRLRDIGDALLDLNETASPGPQQAAAGRPARRAPVAWIGAIVVAAAIAGGVVWRMREPAPALETRADIVTPATSDPLSLALSSDGRRLVFNAMNNSQSTLWLRDLDSAVARPIAGTESAIAPFWSPDGKRIGFFSGGRLKTVDLSGGTPTSLVEATAARGATWSASKIILFTPNTGSGLYQIPEQGGPQQEVLGLLPGTSSLRFPQFLPDGRRFIFYAQGAVDTRGIYLGSLDSREVKRLVDAEAAAQVLGSDWLLFVSQGSLVARRLDLSSGALTGDGLVVSEAAGYDASSNAAALSASAAGTLVYRIGGAGRRQLIWFDRSGKQVGTLGDVDESSLSPALSRDGKRAAILRTVQGNTDIWIVDDRGTTRLTFDPAVDQFPIWSPDAQRIVFRSNRRQGRFDIFSKLANGAGSDEMVLEGFTILGAPNDWSADGDAILFSASSPTTGYDIWAVRTSGDRKPYPFLNSPHEERNIRFSRDGKWVAYQSTESGRPEIYVRPFPGPGGQWQVSTTGGIQPAWRADGKEIYFISPDAKVVAVPISYNGNSVVAGAATPLFQTRIVGGGYDTYSREQYDVAVDGRFLINTFTGDAALAPITLVQNWRPKR